MPGTRSTIGNVNPHGFEALRISIWVAMSRSGARADEQVSAHTESMSHVRAVGGPAPDATTRRPAGAGLPGWPQALAAWLADESSESHLCAQHITSSLGQFGSVCEARALDAGIHGLPTGLELAGRLRVGLDVQPVMALFGLDEQVCAYATWSGIAQGSSNVWGSSLSCMQSRDR